MEIISQQITSHGFHDNNYIYNVDGKIEDIEFRVSFNFQSKKYEIIFNPQDDNNKRLIEKDISPFYVQPRSDKEIYRDMHLVVLEEYCKWRHANVNNNTKIVFQVSSTTGDNQQCNYKIRETFVDNQWQPEFIDTLDNVGDVEASPNVVDVVVVVGNDSQIQIDPDNNRDGCLNKCTACLQNIWNKITSICGD